MRVWSRRLGWIGVLAVAACGGRAQDTTILSAPASDQEEPAEPARSEALDALAEPAARDAFCGWVGASAAGIAGRAGSALDCPQVVDRCRRAASDAALDGPLAVASGLLGASADLEGILGCPVAFGEVDSCLAQLIHLSVARNPEGPACGSAPVQPLGVTDLPSLPSCITVAAECPALLQQLLAARG